MRQFNMNLDLVNLVIGVVGQVGTWLGLFVVFLTLKEMEKQRRESYKPSLFVLSGYFRGTAEEHNEISLPLFWSFGKDDNDMPDGIRIFKVGLGAATSLQFIWSFDLENQIARIKDYCYKNSIPIVVQKNSELGDREWFNF